MGFLNDLQLYNGGRGSSDNPFAQLAQTLGGRLFRQAGLFGDQQYQALLGGGQYDPALAAAARQRAFGSASSALSGGLAQLAAGEGQFLEQRRQFDVGSRLQAGGLDLQSRQLDLQERELEAMLGAAKPNWMDTLVGIGGLLPGVGSIFSGIGALRQSGLFGGG